MIPPDHPRRSADEAGRSKQLLLPRLMASLISLTLIGLGVMAILTEHYYGRTTKSGGAEVSLDGASAIAMGWSVVLFGLFPLALWLPSKRPAIWCMVACFGCAGAALYVSIHLRHG